MIAVDVEHGGELHTEPGLLMCIGVCLLFMQYSSDKNVIQVMERRRFVFPFNRHAFSERASAFWHGKHHRLSIMERWEHQARSRWSELYCKYDGASSADDSEQHALYTGAMVEVTREFVQWLDSKYTETRSPIVMTDNPGSDCTWVNHIMAYYCKRPALGYIPQGPGRYVFHHQVWCCRSMCVPILADMDKSSAHMCMAAGRDVFRQLEALLKLDMPEWLVYDHDPTNDATQRGVFTCLVMCNKLGMQGASETRIIEQLSCAEDIELQWM